MFIMAWRWETVLGTRNTEVRCSPQARTFRSLKFINYSLSSLVFLCSPSASSSFLHSTCYLDDIVLYLWEWPVSNPQRSQWLSTQSPSDRYFRLQGLSIVLLFDHRAAHRAESTAQFKQTYTPQRTCTCGDVFIITAMPSVWPNKNHYAEQGAGGLNKNAVQIVGHFNSPDNNVVMAAMRLDGLLNDSGENQFDRTWPIHAEIPFCMPSSSACHFLDTCN